MLIYAGLLFMCTTALTYEQNRTGDRHIRGPGHKSHHNGSRVDGSHFHNHTFGNKKFPHVDQVGGRPAHRNLPAKDQWDRELFAKLLPVMKKKIQPYLSYLDWWILTKGKKSNSFDEEKDRFIQFVKKVNKHHEHRVETALGAKSEATARHSSGKGARGDSHVHNVHVHAPQRGQGSNFGQVPTSEAGAAQNFPAAGNNAGSEDFPQLPGNRNVLPGRAHGQESPGAVNPNSVEKQEDFSRVQFDSARKKL